MSLESLKLNKQIKTAMQDAGFVHPKIIQSNYLSRFFSGQDWIFVGPEGCGKTTTYILATLMKLKYAFEEAPRALILIPNREKVEQTIAQIELLGKNTDLRIIGLYPGAGMQDQRDELFSGVDIVVGTPDRVTTIYSNSGLNINKLEYFILDDTEHLIKQGFQAQIYRLRDGLPKKCQLFSFSEVYHTKLEKLTSACMKAQGIVEIEEEVEQKIEVVPQELYNVLNFKTKLNLLNTIVGEEQKMIVFSNTRLTAGQLYTSTSKRYPGEVAMLNPLFYNQKGVEDIEEFLESDSLRVLFIANEDEETLELIHVPTLLHFDLPENIEVLLHRVSIKEDTVVGQRSLIFSTDIELSLVKKLENDWGLEFEEMDLPFGVVIQENRKRKKVEEKDSETDNGAFHEKKASNAKDYNWGTKEKIKVFGKKRKKGLK